jgi:hypothetical protein
MIDGMMALASHLLYHPAYASTAHPSQQVLAGLSSVLFQSKVVSRTGRSTGTITGTHASKPLLFARRPRRLQVDY